VQERVRARDRRRLRVLLLRPDRGRELGRRRGYGATGRDLVRLYSSVGADVQVVDDPTLDDLRRVGPTLLERPPDVVHVSAAVTWIGGATVLDFGGDASDRLLPATSGDPGLPVVGLGELVALLSDRSPELGVVLDIARPQTAVEAARCLLIRNSLAQQLLELGHVTAVLATGLAAPAQQEAFYGVLLGGICCGNDFAAVVRQMHAMAFDADLSQALPFLGSALFLSRSPYTLLPLDLA